jgi:hypothetical protein
MACVFFDKSAADWMIPLRFKRGAMKLGAPTTSSTAVAASVASLKRSRDGHIVLPPATWLQRLHDLIVSCRNLLNG